MPAGPEPITATACPVSVPGRLRRDPALLPRAVDDRELDLFDRDRVVLADLEHARRFARRGAEPAGELGEVVGRVQLGDRGRPALAVDEVVPIGDQVAERAAVVAEGHAAVHAARALLAQLLVGRAMQELAVVVRALDRVPVGDPVALDLQEARRACPSGVRSVRCSERACRAWPLHDGQAQMWRAGLGADNREPAHQAATAGDGACASATCSASTRL